MSEAKAELTAFIQLFVQKERQARYLELAEKPKRRSDFVWQLAHDGRHLERQKMRRLASAQCSLAAVNAALAAAGAGKSCLVAAATQGEMDGQHLPTASALAAVVGKGQDVLLFFAEAQLPYYENHEGEQFILQQP